MPVDNVACDVSDENYGYDNDGLDFGEGDDESEISDDDCVWFCVRLLESEAS